VNLGAQWRQLVDQLRRNWTPETKVHIDRARCFGGYTAELETFKKRHAAVVGTRGAQRARDRQRVKGSSVKENAGDRDQPEVVSLTVHRDRGANSREKLLSNVI
jgi:hypothetical protein